MNKRFLCVLSALLVAVGLFMLCQPSQGEDSSILSENYEAVIHEDGLLGRCSGEGACQIKCPVCGKDLYGINGSGRVISLHGICPACQAPIQYPNE